MSKLGVALGLCALVVVACGRVPLGSVPSPSAQSTPTVDSTPVAGETPTSMPTGSSKPTVSPKTSPRSTPSTSRPTPTPSPTFAPLVVNPPSYHPGEVRITYADITFGATGGKAPYSWSLSGGALPDGLGLSSGGAVSGTPTLAGSFGFTALVTDARGVTASSAGSISIANYLAASGLCAKGCSVENLCNTVCGTYAKPAGGVGPFTVSLASGAIPSGTTLGWPALTGTFSGVGAYSFVASVTDSLGAKISVSANYNVFAHIAWRVKSAACGPAYGCTVTLTYSMGTPGGTPTLSFGKVICGNPPCTGKAPEPVLNTLPKSPCFTYSVDPLKSAVTMSFGSPGTCGDWVGSFIAKITDQNLCAPGPAYCSANVTVTVDSEAKYG
jgi:putative Ig domain-containing protein